MASPFRSGEDGKYDGDGRKEHEGPTMDGWTGGWTERWMDRLLT